MSAEKGKLLSKHKDVASTFSEPFGSITDSLDLFSLPGDNSISAGNGKVSSIIEKLAFHPRMKAIKKKKLELIFI